MDEATELLMRASVLAGDDEDGDDLVERLLLQRDAPADDPAPASRAGMALHPTAGTGLGATATQSMAHGSRAVGGEQQSPEAIRRGSAGGEDTMPAELGSADDQDEADSAGDEDPGLEEASPSEAGMSTAASESGAWGRVIRQPRKRGGHVIVDVCAPLASLSEADRAALDRAASQLEGSSGVDGGRKGGTRRRGAVGGGELRREGALVQQVVSVGDKRGRLGPAGYSLARKARWGDLWPYLSR